MLYQARPPRSELAGFVRCLWRLQGDPGEIEPQPILPDGCFELILHLGEPFVERESHPSDTGAPPHDAPIETRQGRALVAATLTRSVVVAASGAVDVVGVRFHPGRAYPFLAAAPAELVDTVAPAVDVVARELAVLAAWLEPAGTEALFSAVETALLERLARAGSDRRFDRLVEALIAPDAPAVATLAGAAGLSQRQFERLFKSRAGVSAKVLQRVVRFHRVAAGLLDGSLDLAALALDAGFYDQAHMSREFRSLAEVTPARYPAQAGALDRLFAES